VGEGLGCEEKGKERAGAAERRCLDVQRTWCGAPRPRGAALKHRAGAEEAAPPHSTAKAELLRASSPRTGEERIMAMNYHRSLTRY
jgi:hypothetical protein